MTPQAPQLFESAWVLLSQPFAEAASQSRNPALQLETLQTPLVQAAVALARVQTVPFALIVTGVQEPTPSQDIASVQAVAAAQDTDTAA